MVSGVPASVLLIPLEHRKIDHPQELQIRRIEQLVPVVVFLPRKQSQLSARLEERLVGTMALGFPRPSSQHEEVLIGCAARCPRALRNRRWNLLQIVVNAQSPFCSKRLQLIAFFTAQR